MPRTYHLLVFKRWLGRHWGPLLAAAALFAAELEQMPIGKVIRGERWAGWWDQSLYLRSASAFAHLDLDAANHWYPLLYPLLAAPFCWLIPTNPFLLLDLICYALTAHFVLRVARLLDIGPIVGLLLLLGSTFLHPGFRDSWTAPWTSTLSTVLLWFVIANVGEILLDPERRELKPARAARLGLATAMIAMTRPADVIVPAVIGGVLAIALIAGKRLPIRVGLAAVVAAMSGLAVYASLYLAIYGAHANGYMALSAGYGLRFDNLGWKASVLFVDPRPWFPVGTGLLRAVPWLAFGIAGSLTLLASRRPGMRAFATALLGAVLAYMMMMAAYVDLLPAALWEFNNVHYFKWLLPFFALTGWHLLRTFSTAPRTGAAAVASVLAITGLRYDALPATPTEPARRVDFAAIPRDWRDFYFSPSIVVDASGVRRNVLEYRQILDGDRVRAIALRRDFAGDERLIADARTLTRWPPATVWEQVRLKQPPSDRPLARWKVHLTWGIPCWITPCVDRR